MSIVRKGAGRGATRLRELRERSGLTLEKVAAAAMPPTSAAQVSRLESGERPFTYAWAKRLAPVFEVDPFELLADFQGASVPLRFAVAAAFSEAPDDMMALGRVYVPPTVPRPEDCFAAVVCDDSADRLYPPGTILIVRELVPPAEMRPGDKVLAEHYATDLAAGDVLETLVGRFEITQAGDLALSLRTDNRRLPASIAIRRAPEPAAAERARRWPAGRQDSALYAPAEGDTARVLGVVVFAMSPE